MQTDGTPPVDGETVADKALGTSSTPTDSEPKTTEGADKPKDDAVLSAAEIEQARKERDQAIMERNNLRKKIEEQETAALKEKEDWKALAERAEAKLAEAEAEKERENARSEAEKFRKDFIAKQPEQLQKALNTLVEANSSNFLWTNAKDWDDAAAQLDAQAKAIAAGLGIDLEDDGNQAEATPPPRVHSNNPAPANLKGQDFENMSWEDMRKVLPKAER